MIRYLALGLALGMIGIGLFGCPGKGNAGASLFDRRVDELLTWASNYTGYSREGIKPHISFKTTDEINRIYFGDQYNGQNWALAMTSGSNVFLPIGFTLGRDDWQLVHELVHVLQFENGIEFDCNAPRELEAYEAQIAFIEETGIGKDNRDANPMLLMIVLRGDRFCDFGDD